MEKYTIQQCIDQHMVIHCETQEIWDTVHEAIMYHNPSGDPIDRERWKTYEESSCLAPNWDGPHYSPVDYYRGEGRKVIKPYQLEIPVKNNYSIF